MRGRAGSAGDVLALLAAELAGWFVGEGGAGGVRGVGTLRARRRGAAAAVLPARRIETRVWTLIWLAACVYPCVPGCRVRAACP